MEIHGKYIDMTYPSQESRKIFRTTVVAKCGKETSKNWSLKGLEGFRMERSFTNRIAVVLLAAGTWLLRRQGNGSMVTASLALAWFQGELLGKIRVYTYQNNQMLVVSYKFDLK